MQGEFVLQQCSVFTLINSLLRLLPMEVLLLLVSLNRFLIIQNTCCDFDRTSKNERGIENLRSKNEKTGAPDANKREEEGDLLVYINRLLTCKQQVSVFIRTILIGKLNLWLLPIFIVNVVAFVSFPFNLLC